MSNTAYNANKGGMDQPMTFYEKMRIVCLAIPEGKVATYGQIAMLCGKPRNARQVGFVLRENLAGNDIPAFRVVNGKGELSGAVHFHIPGLQKHLLEEDGIEVFWNGQNWCVNLKEYGWKTTIGDVDAFARKFEQH